jgi:predicted nucleic-acid-binding protein
LPITVVLELAWVLQSFYEFSSQNLRAVLAAHADELVTFDYKKLARRAWAYFRALDLGKL